MQRQLSPFYSRCRQVVSPIGFAMAPTTVPLMARSSWLVAHCFFCELSVLSTSLHGRYGFLFWLVCVSHSAWSGAFPSDVSDAHPHAKMQAYVPRLRREPVGMRKPSRSPVGRSIR